METETMQTVDVAKENAKKFQAFIYSPETSKLTPSQAAEKLGIKTTYFRTLHANLKKSVERLRAAGHDVPEVPALANGRIGKVGRRVEHNATERALLDMVKNA